MKIMTYLKILILFMMAASLSSQLYSQKKTEIKRYMIIRNSPRFTLQLNLDYNQAFQELSGAYNDDYQSESVYKGQTFGADKGYGGTIMGKLALNERGSFRFIQTLTYNRILAYTFGDKNNVADDGFANYNCFTGGLGVEYNFTPRHKFKMYFQAELNASLINGDLRIWFYNPPIPTSDTNYTVLNSFRMGFGLSLGSEYLINDKFGLNLGARLINANLFLRQAEGNNGDKEFKLRDKDAPGLSFAGDKNFSFFSIYFGVNFYFGVNSKIYKLN